MDPQVELWLKNVYEALQWTYVAPQEPPPRGELTEGEVETEGVGEDRLVQQAQAIRDDPRMNEVVAHATSDETQEVYAARGYIEEALDRDPLTTSNITAARQLLSGLGAALVVARAAVQERFRREADLILNHGDLTAVVPDANGDEMAQAQTARAKVRLILARTPLAPKDLNEAKQQLAIIGPALERARQAAANRLATEAQRIRDEPVMQETVPHATGEELQAVQVARTRIATQLDTQPLTTVNVVAARNGLLELALAIAAARNVVLERLRGEAERIRNDERMNATVEGTAENDLAQAQTARAKIRLILARTPLAPKDLQEAEQLLGTVSAGLEKARQLVAERRKTAESIRKDPRLAEVVADATEEDLKTVVGIRQAITELLSQSPLSATNVAAAHEKLTKELDGALVTAKSVVRQRKEAAEKIRNDARMKDAVAGATEDDVTDVVSLRRTITELLSKKPLSAQDVSDANEKLTKDLQQALNTAKSVVQQRKEAAEKIRNDARMKDAVAGATEDDMKDVVSLRRTITELLSKKPLSAQDVHEANEKLTKELDGAVATAKEVVRKRKEAAHTVRTDEAMTAATNDAAPDDLRPLTDARRKVTEFLNVQPLTDDAVSKARDALTNVKSALEQLRKIVQERQDEAKKLREAIASDQPLYLGPEGAFPHQVGELQRQCGVVGQKLATTPLSASALQAAKEEKSKLDALYKDLEEAVAALGKDKALELVQALGQQKIEALQQAFRFPDAKKLAAFIQDIGGKDALQKLLVSFPPAELKKACDNFGGAKCVEQVLTVGCNGRAADMKKLVDLFATEDDKRNLKGLIETGGLGKNPVVLGKTLEAAIVAERAKALQRKKQQALQLNPNANVSGMTLTQTELATAEEEGRKQLKALATAFKEPADQKRLASLLDAGGLGANPATLGAVMQTAYGGDATKLRDLAAAFPVPDPQRLGSNDPTATRQAKNLEDLRGVLTRGGLGERPEVFAWMLPPKGTATTDKLKEFCGEFGTPTDQDKLRDLTRNGLGGTPPESPARLAQVLSEGVGGRPADLKTLHASFYVNPPPGSDLPKMKTMFDAFATPPPPSQVGKRLERVTGKVGSLNAVKTRYFDNVSKNTRSGAARKVTDRVGSNTATQTAIQQAAKAKVLANQTGASDETKNGAAAVQAANEAQVAAALAGAGAAPTDPIANGLAASITKSADAGAKIAEMGASVATVASDARNAARLEVLNRQPPVPPNEVDAAVVLLENQRKQAAIVAANQAQQAAVAARQAAQLAAQPNAPANVLQDARDKAKAAAEAAEAAVLAASQTSDEATIKDALAKAADAAKAAAETAADAAGRHAQSKAQTKANGAADKLKQGGSNAVYLPGGVDWKGKSTELDEAGAATLAAVVAADPTARKRAIEAAQLAEVARQTCADPTATSDAIAAARLAAQQAATVAASAAAVAATTAANHAVNALPLPPTVPTAAQLAAVIAAADAASAAGLAANDNAAKNAANNAYDAALSASVRSQDFEIRSLGGGAILQKRKANGRVGAPPLTFEDALRIGSTFEKLNLNQVVDNANLGNGPPPSRSRHEADQQHICGRHTRDYFTFDAQELPAEDEMIQACLMTAWTRGYVLNQTEIDVIAQLNTKAKKTTLFPEGVSKAKVKQYVEDAVKYIRDHEPGAATGDFEVNTTQKFLSLTTAWVQWTNIPVSDGYRVTIGLQRLTGHYKVAQMYPTSGPGLETVDYFDMRTLKGALNV